MLFSKNYLTGLGNTRNSKKTNVTIPEREWGNETGTVRNTNFFPGVMRFYWHGGWGCYLG